MRKIYHKQITAQSPNRFILRQDQFCWSDSPAAQTLCFTGHRHLSAEEETTLAVLLDQTIVEYYWRGYHTFLCGGALGFDTLAAEAVLRLRALQRDIRLILAIPCRTQPDRWHVTQRDRYQQILSEADEIVVLSPVYYNGCMQVRNRYMVNRSSCVIAYLRDLHGGTLHTTAYALSKGVHVVNLAMKTES